ncbi:MAG: substrate-binding domain-containing protein [Burkholderiales bacterium]|nr:substrate-binding domain-containing protein [Burkholderiales bacterium]
MSEPITVMATAAVHEAFKDLLPAFESSTGLRVAPLWMPTVDMIARLRSGAVVDVVLLSGAAIDDLTASGVIALPSRADIVRSSVGMAVRAGAPKPDIGSTEAFTRSVLAATSIAYSTGPSGVYIAALFERLGVASQLRDRVRQVKGIPVGSLVARGEAQIGFQQVSELLPVAGIELLGPLPAAIECVTVFAAGVHVESRQVEPARRLISFLRSPEAAAVFLRTGLDPVRAGG